MPTIDNVIDQARIKQIRAFAGQTAFDYPFPIFASTDLVVNVNGVDLAPTAYVITGVFDDTGGTVTLVAAAAANDLVTIYADTAIERLTDYEFRGRFDSQRFNNELDRMTINHQELRDQVRRAVRLPITGEIAETDDFALPQTIAARADRVVGFDSAGAIELRSVADGEARSLALNSQVEGLRDLIAVDPTAIIDRVPTIAAMLAIPAPADGASVEVTEQGRGGVFVFDSSLVGAANNGTTFKAADGTVGSWDRRFSGPVYPRWFGAVGDNVTDDTAALQAFFDACAATDFGTADYTGRFSISAGVTYGNAAVLPLTKKFDGFMELTASAAIPVMFETIFCRETEWDSIRITGTGSATYATRTCEVGFLISDCGRMRFKRIFARYFSFAGVMAKDGNNNLATLGDVQSGSCGAGVAGNSPGGNWSNPVNFGGSESSSQRSQIDVDVLPPSYVVDGTYAAVGDTPYLVRIGGRTYFIYSIDTVNSRLSIHPWLSSADVPGAFEYVFGGGVVMRGADTNVWDIYSIDASGCGIGLNMQALYGPFLRRLVAQGCGTGLLVGRQPAGATLGGMYGNVYLENNSEDISLLFKGSTNQYNLFLGEYAAKPEKISFIAGSRSSVTDRVNFDTLERNPMFIRGDAYFAERKKSRNQTSSTLPLTPRYRGETMVWNRNTATINLGPLDEDFNRLTATDSMLLVCHGTGANNQPAGTVTINAPAGWTVNGGAGPLVYSSIQRPLVFALQWMIDTTDVLVTELNNGQVLGDGTTGGAVSAGAGNQYVEMTVNGVTYRVLHDGTV